MLQDRTPAVNEEALARSRSKGSSAVDAFLFFPLVLMAAASV